MQHSNVMVSAAEARRRGACPTLDAPMQTGDGLLARIRISGNRLHPVQLAELARLAERHGNGIVEISARGNLQVRGLTAESAPVFAAAVTNLVALESGPVLDTSPLAGDDPAEIASPLPLLERLRDGLAAVGGRLGPKVSVVIDGGGQISLAALKADIRLVALDEGRWSVSLGGGKAQAMDEGGAIAASLAVLAALAAIGPTARAGDLFPYSDAAGSTDQRDTETPVLKPLRLRDGETLPIALPFGQIDAPALLDLALAAEGCGVTNIRLAPRHLLLLDRAPGTLLSAASALGFIIDGADPLLRAHACIGNRGCASGHIDARQLAARHAPLLPDGQVLHVSGCAKGCAHPRRADVTLVGSENAIGLVIDGQASDTPAMTLNETEIASVLAARQEGR